jgi:hypothetical protein
MKSFKQFNEALTDALAKDRERTKEIGNYIAGKIEKFPERIKNLSQSYKDALERIEQRKAAAKERDKKPKDINSPTQNVTPPTPKPEDRFATLKKKREELSKRAWELKQIGKEKVAQKATVPVATPKTEPTPTPVSEPAPSAGMAAKPIEIPPTDSSLEKAKDAAKNAVDKAKEKLGIPPTGTKTPKPDEPGQVGNAQAGSSDDLENRIKQLNIQRADIAKKGIGVGDPTKTASERGMTGDSAQKYNQFVAARDEKLKQDLAKIANKK